MPGWTLPGVVTAGGVDRAGQGPARPPGPARAPRRDRAAAPGRGDRAGPRRRPRRRHRRGGAAPGAPRPPAPPGNRRPDPRGDARALADADLAGPRARADRGRARRSSARSSRGSTTRWRPVAGTERTVDVDTVVLGYGLVPSPELADLAGCALAYDAGRGGWIPVADPARLMATSAPGVFVAGDGAGVAGADVAEAEGRLAGLGAAQHVGRLGEAEVRAPSRARPRDAPPVRCVPADPRADHGAAPGALRAGDGGHDRLPVRGGPRRRDPRRHRGGRTAGDRGARGHAGRHGPLPGTSLRPDRVRAPRALGRRVARDGRPPAAPAARATGPGSGPGRSGPRVGRRPRRGGRSAASPPAPVRLGEPSGVPAWA